MKMRTICTYWYKGINENHHLFEESLLQGVDGYPMRI
jgi:hypothetical protein